MAANEAVEREQNDNGTECYEAYPLRACDGVTGTRRSDGLQHSHGSKAAQFHDQTVEPGPQAQQYSRSSGQQSDPNGLR